MDALHFSGGLDSLATLYVLRDQWDWLTVMWCNTGAAYPETVELMEQVRRRVPHFQEVSSDQPADIAKHGYPADLVPVRATEIGHLAYGTSGAKFRSAFECCRNNIWIPLAMATADLGAKTVYRGQRASDRLKAPIPSGTVDENGVRYEFPIEHWTRAQVQGYVHECCPDLLPYYYSRGERSSHDCWDCTAYLFDNQARIANLPAPKRDVVRGRLDVLEAAVRLDHMHLTYALEASHG